MKKIFFLSMAALAVVSCSSDKEEAVVEHKLVKATMTAETPETLTRAYLGHIDDEHGVKVIGVKFQLNDAMDVYEFCSYQSGTKYVFTNLQRGDYQSANFTGVWTDDLSSWAAIFPASANNKMVAMSNDAKNGTGNTYEFVIPQNQSTINGPDGGVTYQNEANVMVAARYKKVDVETPTCCLNPVVAYLYFASSEEHVDITSTAGAICGTATCHTTKNTWANWEDFNECATITGSNNSDDKVIHSTGKYMERSKMYEHIVCLLPGSFGVGQLVIGSKANTVARELHHVNMYYLGDIDPATAND